MGSELVKVVQGELVEGSQDAALPAVVVEAGSNARFAYEEFFFGQLANEHTRAAYQRAVHRFLGHVHDLGLSLQQITPKLVRSYLDRMPLSVASQKQHLAALKHFFDVCVTRHAIALNPAAAVRGRKLQVVEGKTPQVTIEQARTLLRSIDTTTPIGKRDLAVIATLVYTGARVGAVARLRVRDFQNAGHQHVLRFNEKGGKSREIPVRHDLQLMIADYITAAGIADDRDAPLFRRAANRKGDLKTAPTRRVFKRGPKAGTVEVFDRLDATPVDLCRMVKRRLADAELPSANLSPHSFRVTVATDLLEQDVPLDQVQYLLGHADPRTTRLYDRRGRKVSRNVVERISV